MSKKLLLKKHMIDLSFLVYIVVVLYGVFSPHYGLQTNYLRLNIIPFNWIWVLITGYYTNIVTVYRSITISFALLMPLGFLLPFIFNNVRPSKEHEYLPTQTISKYFRDNANNCDGIIFSSSLSNSGENIIVFNPKGKVEDVSSLRYANMDVINLAYCPKQDGEYLSPFNSGKTIRSGHGVISFNGMHKTFRDLLVGFFESMEI